MQFLTEEAMATALELEEAGQQLRSAEEAKQAAAIARARARAQQGGGRG